MQHHDVISHEIVYPQPRKRVWEALTEPAQLSAWLMDTDFEARPGRKFTFFEHEPWPDGDFVDVQCEVVECDPPKRLAYTWTSPTKMGTTLVTWDPYEVAGGTRVCLTHSGFAAHGDAGQMVRALLDGGWGGLLREELAAYLLSGSPARRHAPSA
jgi:uncharacterized protein YndB with AHSA1/START domain